MREAIKELKLDIINGYEFRHIEFEEQGVPMGLMYEDGKIIYYALKDEFRGSIIYYKEEFFKTKINDIIKRINETYYYL